MKASRGCLLWPPPQALAWMASVLEKTDTRSGTTAEALLGVIFNRSPSVARVLLLRGQRNQAKGRQSPERQESTAPFHAWPPCYRMRKRSSEGARGESRRLGENQYIFHIHVPVCTHVYAPPHTHRNFTTRV